MYTKGRSGQITVVDNLADVVFLFVCWSYAADMVWKTTRGIKRDDLMIITGIEISVFPFTFIFITTRFVRKFLILVLKKRK